MTAVEDSDGALAGYRVLDLADSKGHFCGKVLADLGAEVIKIEKPSGDDTRRLGPFKGDVPHPEGSLYFLNFNTNKKSVTLDLESPQGQEAFRKLVRRADALIESFPPGTMERLGLSYRSLREINPGLVMASITGFGPTGPYKDYQAPDIVCFAMGGLMSLCGNPDQPPLAAPWEQTYQLASIHAAYGVLLALYHRLATGLGQHVEVSLQEVQASLQYMIVNYSANALILPRLGGRVTTTGAAPCGIYPCKDGYAHFFVLAPWHWKAFLEWIGQPEALSAPVWSNRHFRAQNIDVIDPFVRDFAAPYSKAELYEQGQARHLPLAPVNTPKDFAEDIHTQARGYFVEVEHPYVGRHKYPGAPYKLSATPWRIRRPAPLIGQHNAEILAERLEAPSKGLPTSELPPLGAARGALTGVRVLDFTQAIAGPVMTKMLAEHGAEVIKVESSTHQQRGRGSPYGDARVALQQAVTFADNNRNKKNISVNMGTAKGRDLIKRLVKISDVVAENFSPRVMQGWNLDYPHLREIKPDIVMASLPGFGLTGPRRNYLSVASTVMAVTGMYHLWAYPEVPEPVGPSSLHPDYVAAAHGAVAVMAALHHRARTGQGQLIDLAQMEAMASLLGPVYLGYFVNGRVPQPLGNRSPYAAPCGCYRCRGYDRWCVIAVGSEEQWRAFCRAIGEPSWTKEARFSDLAGRLAHHDELDQRVEEWTVQHTPYQVMRTLQGAEVAAGAVQNMEDLYHDIHLRQRGFIVPIDHPDTGRIEYPGVTVRLSETPGAVGSWARLGEDNEYVFGELLGLSRGESARLAEEGVLV